MWWSSSSEMSWNSVEGLCPFLWSVYPSLWYLCSLHSTRLKVRLVKISVPERRIGSYVRGKADEGVHTARQQVGGKWREAISPLLNLPSSRGVTLLVGTGPRPQGETGCQGKSEGANIMALELVRFCHWRVSAALCRVVKGNFSYFDLILT